MNVIVTNFQEETYSLLITKLNPKLVLTHYSIQGVEIIQKIKIPYVQVIQNTYMWFSDYQKKAFESAAKKTTAFIALSDFVKEYSITLLGVSRKKIIVLPCGFDSVAYESIDKKFARDQIRTKLGINKNDFVYLSVGSINHQKNHISTVHSFAEISSKIPSAKLVIIGPVFEDYLLNEILEFIDKNNLQSKIIYGGAVDGAQEYYAMADVFVSASFFEGGPLNLLEALYSNLPVIITDVGLATHFKEKSGIQIIKPPLNIFEYSGQLTELKSTIEFEDILASAMLSAYKKYQRPNLPESILQLMDRKVAYQQYVEIISSLISDQYKGKLINRPNWIDKIETNYQ